jgi:hypothetical protein
VVEIGVVRRRHGSVRVSEWGAEHVIVVTRRGLDACSWWHQRRRLRNVRDNSFLLLLFFSGFSNRIFLKSILLHHTSDHCQELLFCGFVFENCW